MTFRTATDLCPDFQKPSLPSKFLATRLSISSRTTIKPNHPTLRDDSRWNKMKDFPFSRSYLNIRIKKTQGGMFSVKFASILNRCFSCCLLRQISRVTCDHDAIENTCKWLPTNKLNFQTIFVTQIVAKKSCRPYLLKFVPYTSRNKWN